MPEFLATLEPLFQTFLCVQYLNFEGGLVFAFKIEKVFCVKRKLLKWEKGNWYQSENHSKSLTIVHFS